MDSFFNPSKKRQVVQSVSFANTWQHSIEAKFTIYRWKSYLQTKILSYWFLKGMLTLNIEHWQTTPFPGAAHKVRLTIFIGWLVLWWNVFDCSQCFLSDLYYTRFCWRMPYPYCLRSATQQKGNNLLSPSEYSKSWFPKTRHNWFWSSC